jgi:hypothetical protein
MCVLGLLVANRPPGVGVVEPTMHAVHLDDPDFIKHIKVKKFLSG